MLGADISTAPVIIQERLIPKTDIRVTVVGDFVFAVTITEGGRGVDRDWRLEKDNVVYTPVSLPSEVETRCRRLVAELGLKFGALDLAFHEGRYYFLEINPTGEWAWLLRDAGTKIDEAIGEALWVSTAP